MDALTPAMFDRFIEKLRNEPLRPRVLAIPVSVKNAYEYVLSTVVVWSLPGAIRKRGPDGKTWIEKKWRTADVARGNGNKSKRRMGLVPTFGYFGDVTWTSESPQ